MPLYDPLISRGTGLPQGWNDRFRQPTNVLRGTSANLIPCYHARMRCPKCGYYNLRSPECPTVGHTLRCSHCKRAAQVIEYCQGYAAPDSPLYTKGQQIISVEGYDIETRWVKRDGSRAKIKKHWGVARS